jgi:hypothetical protein
MHPLLFKVIRCDGKLQPTALFSLVTCLKALCWLAYQGKDIVFRFIIEYSSLRDFGPLGSRSIFIWGVLKDDIFAHVETWN